jgi:hypothetical protein
MIGEMYLRITRWTCYEYLEFTPHPLAELLKPLSEEYYKCITKGVQ